MYSSHHTTARENVKGVGGSFFCAAAKRDSSTAWADPFTGANGKEVNRPTSFGMTGLARPADAGPVVQGIVLEGAFAAGACVKRKLGDKRRQRADFGVTGITDTEDGCTMLPVIGSKKLKDQSGRCLRK